MQNRAAAEKVPQHAHDVGSLFIGNASGDGDLILIDIDYDEEANNDDAAHPDVQ